MGSQKPVEKSSAPIVLERLQTIGAILTSVTAYFVALAWIVGQTYYHAYFSVIGIPMTVITQSVWEVVNAGWGIVVSDGIVKLSLAFFGWLVIYICAIAVFQRFLRGMWIRRIILVGIFLGTLAAMGMGNNGASVAVFLSTIFAGGIMVDDSEHVTSLSFPAPSLKALDQALNILRFVAVIFGISYILVAYIVYLQSRADNVGRYNALSALATSEHRITTITTHFPIPELTPMPPTAAGNVVSTEPYFVYEKLDLLLITSDRIYLAVDVDSKTCRPTRVIALDRSEIINSSWTLAGPRNYTCPTSMLTATPVTTPLATPTSVTPTP